MLNESPIERMRHHLAAEGNRATLAGSGRDVWFLHPLAAQWLLCLACNSTGHDYTTSNAGVQVDAGQPCASGDPGCSCRESETCTAALECRGGRCSTSASNDPNSVTGAHNTTAPIPAPPVWSSWSDTTHTDAAPLDAGPNNQSENADATSDGERGGTGPLAAADAGCQSDCTQNGSGRGSTGLTTQGCDEGACAAPAVCGNAVCEAAESASSCCTDCGCSPGNSCIEGACRTDAFCGDGSCNDGENSSTCCTDCACSPGSSCIEGACRVDAFCGDGSCDVGENSGSCCVDCGCSSGSSCVAGVCRPDPFCGDGSCNGGESMSSCCSDCGCADNYTCTGGACQCTESSVLVQNVLPDSYTFCPNLYQFYTQYSAAYINFGSEWIYMPDGGWVDYDGALGSTIQATAQCCYLDACLGNLTCPTPSGNYPCLCADAFYLNMTVSACGQNYVPLCN